MAEIFVLKRGRKRILSDQLLGSKYNLGSLKNNRAFGLYKRETLTNCLLEIVSQAQKSSFLMLIFLLPLSLDAGKREVSYACEWALLEHLTLYKNSWWFSKACPY